MVKDTRFFAKFTVDFPRNPKIKPLSDAAFRCIVEATIYSRDHLTDGFLARRLALASWSLQILQELCTNDDEKPSLIERPEGWYIPDYAEHQDTKADVEARRDHARAAGQKGGLAKAKQSAKQPAKQRASKVLSKNVAEERRKIDNSLTTSVVREHARGTRLPDDWRPHVNPETLTGELPGVDVHLEYEKFCDYWRAQPGVKGRKTDWEATWRNWLRRAAEQTPRNSAHANSVTPPATRKVNAGLELAAKFAQTSATELDAS